MIPTTTKRSNTPKTLKNPRRSKTLKNPRTLFWKALLTYTFLTPFLQDKYKENLNRNLNINKKEPKEGRDCQGKGEDLSADAESCSVSKGENKYLKDLKDPINESKN
jgi:hypothetical protein